MDTRILVATDGSHGSVGALRVARVLAERHHHPPEVVTVHPPALGYGSGPFYPVPVGDAGIDMGQAERTRERAQQQVDAVVGASAGWTVRLEIGPPAPSIVRAAIERRASLIVVGLGRHAASDRWFGSETALHVAHLAHVPVLAIPATAAGLPARAVVGVDFSAYSLSAVRATAALLPPGSRMRLAHVGWPAAIGPGAGGTGWARDYQEGARTRLESLAEEVRSSGGLDVTVSCLEGDPAREILALAEREDADLVAVGSHGAGFLTRLLLGSVCTRVLRESRMAVLLAPPASIPDELRPVAVELAHDGSR